MTDGPVDLHLHSNLSCDGDLSPETLVRLAGEQGFEAVSIADHDTVAAYPDVLAVGRAVGVEVVPSMEVTTLYDGREFHVLLPFVDWASPVVARLAERVAAGRFEEARERVSLLERLGFDLAWPEVEAATNGVAPLGVRIAQILLDKPASAGEPRLAAYFEDDGAFGPYLFYRDYFAEDKPAFVPKRHVPLVDVLDLAPAARAVPVLSHPGAYFQRTTREDLLVLKARGLAGLEVFTSYHTAEQTAHYGRLAAELDLVPTAGSDFHGRIKPHVAFGSLREGRYWMVEKLRARRRNGKGDGS
jgi:predicted metal-dependent phosphoesterase TrpH